MGNGKKLKIALSFLAFETDLHDNKNGTYSFEDSKHGWIDVFPHQNWLKIRKQPYVIKNAFEFLKEHVIKEDITEIINLK